MNEQENVSPNLKTIWNEDIREVDLKDPLIAGTLAWLVPGLGHLYQGRVFKGVLFFVCIVPLLAIGIWMGSYRETVDPNDPSSKSQLHIGRNVYCSWREGDKRLYFVPQAMIGSVAIPAVLQANRAPDGRSLFPGNLFLPPRIPNDRTANSTGELQPTLDRLIARLHSYFELGTIFVVVAGLLNLLALMDAIGGPVWVIADEKKSKQNDDNQSAEQI